MMESMQISKVLVYSIIEAPVIASTKTRSYQEQSIPSRQFGGGFRQCASLNQANGRSSSFLPEVNTIGNISQNHSFGLWKPNELSAKDTVPVDGMNATLLLNPA
jgi:hypothetical protein